MQSLRRLYLYAVAFVSLEVVLWGAIGLARSFFAGGSADGSTTQLAQALSLVLVGVPVFLLHWWLIQRSVKGEPGERSALLRAIFLYGVMLVTLLAVVNNSLSLIDRTLALIFGMKPSLAPLGGMQSLSDNLIAGTLNALAAAYFYTVLRVDWKARPVGDDFAFIRRLYRYVWVVYGLGMAAIGLQRALEYLLLWLDPGSPPELTLLTSALALLLVGAPIWVYCWWVVQRSLVEPAERDSTLRLVVLFALVFISAAGGLVSAILALQTVLAALLNLPSPPVDFFADISEPLSAGLSFGLVWFYYHRVLRAENAPASTAALEESSPQIERRARLQRIHAYVMALYGLVGAFFGLLMLVIALVDLVIDPGLSWGESLRQQMAGSLAALLVSLPLWFLTWRPLTREAAAEAEAGEAARRSLVRRGYLYLALFAGVMGVMFSAGGLLFQLLNAFLGNPGDTLLLQSLQLLLTMLLFAALLGYHGWVLRSDNRQTERLLARRRAKYPVLVLAPAEEGISEALVAALEQEAPDLPVAVHPIEQGAPDETFSAAKAVILPAELLTTPGEALRLWLRAFDGKRIVIITPAGDWLWVPQANVVASSRNAARLARRLAEGEDIAG